MSIYFGRPFSSSIVIYLFNQVEALQLNNIKRKAIISREGKENFPGKRALDFSPGSRCSNTRAYSLTLLRLRLNFSPLVRTVLMEYIHFVTRYFKARTYINNRNTVNSRYNEVGYNEIPAYNEMEIFPQRTKCINFNPLITNIRI